MSNQAWDAKWGLVILATAADAFGVAGYLGIQASWSVRVGIAMFFFIVAVISASFTLRAELSLWLSPRGSYYASSFHVKRTITGFIAVVAAVVFGIYLVVAVLHQAHGSVKEPAHHTELKTPAPSSTAKASSHSLVFLGI